MEISKKTRSLLSVCGYKSRIDTNPDFQRPAEADQGVWPTKGSGPKMGSGRTF